MNHVPFLPRFLPLIRARRKWATTRTRKLGEVGDILDTDTGAIQLTRVERLSLDHVAETHHEAEGCESPQGFIDVWREIHPRAGWTPKAKKWYHEFTYLGDDA